MNSVMLITYAVHMSLGTVTDSSLGRERQRNGTVIGNRSKTHLREEREGKTEKHRV